MSERPIDIYFADMARTGDSGFAIAFALLQVAEQIARLGSGDTASPIGAIEAFGVHLGEHLDTLTTGLDGIADAIREHGEDE